VTGVDGLSPLLWGAFFFWLTVTPIAGYVKTGQQRSGGAKFRRSRDPADAIAFVTAFVFGIVDNGGLSMLSVYSTMNGYDYSQAALLAAVAMMGGIALQIPLGYAANNSEPRVVLAALRCGAIALLMVLPRPCACIPRRWASVSCSAVSLEGFYTVGLICIANHCRSVGISSANGCFISFCGFGEFVGPLATGTSIQYLGTNGFVVGLTLLLAVYIVTIGLVQRGASAQAQYAH
jgi:hypothetical protein